MQWNALLAVADPVDSSGPYLWKMDWSWPELTLWENELGADRLHKPVRIIWSWRRILWVLHVRTYSFQVLYIINTAAIAIIPTPANASPTTSPHSQLLLQGHPYCTDL